jgi:hypothetical protein
MPVVHNSIGELENQVRELRNQLNGTTNPRTDESNPGHILILLGWKYTGDIEPEDPYGCNWEDPEAPTGRRSLMPITMALSIALRRLFERGNRADRLIRGEDPLVLPDK